jgi:hypothetical protein
MALARKNDTLPRLYIHSRPNYRRQQLFQSGELKKLLGIEVGRGAGAALNVTEEKCSKEGTGRQQEDHS